MSKQEIVYLKHPVTPEKKAEYRKKGAKILDIKFKPKDDKPAAKQTAKE